MDERTLTVSELAAMVNAALQTCFDAGVWVQGEIRGIKRSRSGHVYFDLVEPPSPDGPGDDPAAGSARRGSNQIAQVPVVLFEGRRKQVNHLLRNHGNPIRMDDGVRIRIQGHLDYYAPYGKLSLQMTAIDPAFTLGALVSERDALLAHLKRTSRLRANAARALPTVPQRIGIVTSLGSAAHADITKVFRRSGLAFTLVEIDTPVQGFGAERRIAAALRAAADAEAEVVVLARGGGAKTDLAVFDHAVVAEAIAASPIPVFCGIGHDTDRSVADETAHTAAATPTAAAGAVVDLAKDYLAGLDDRQRRLAHLGRQATTAASKRLRQLSRGVDRSTTVQLSLGHQRLAGASRRLAHASDRVTASAASQLDQAAARTTTAPRSILRVAASRVGSAEARVRALDPARALARGWSITRGPDGSVLRSVADAAPGAELSTRVVDGTLTSTVTQSEARDAR